MASYHFRVKSDKKADGKKISAPVHVDYIQREGKYENEGSGKDEKIFLMNVLTSEKVADILEGNFAPLYVSDLYGSIANTYKGIGVSKNFSDTTVLIALELAKKTMQNEPLIVKGSKFFQNKILNLAAENELEISFRDEKMQTEFVKRKEQVKNEREKFISNGGTILPARTYNPKPNFAEVERRTLGAFAKKGIGVPTLSERNLAHSKQKNADLSLLDDEYDSLVNDRKKFYSSLRWNDGAEKVKYAELYAEKILQSVNESKNVAVSHVNYIERTGKFERRGDCIYTDNQLPSWANGDAKKFFEMADKFEGQNRRKYVELEFSLPNELTSIEQYKQIIDKFAEKHLQNHYFAYAIHEKLGVMSEGERHPHVHLMLSERLIDEVEREKERTPENYFKYPFRKINGGREPTFEEKWKRGAPKDRRWNGRENIIELRADFARIQNEVLKKNGFSVRVDHRSLKEQKAEAERNGDILLAQILDREPEKYIGLVNAHKNAEKIDAVKRERQFRTEKINNLLENYAEQQKAMNADLKERSRKLIAESFEMLDKPEVREEKNPTSQKLVEELQKSVQELNIWRNLLANNEEVKRSAEMEYMTEKEKKIWQKNFELTNRKAKMEETSRNLQTIKTNSKNTPEQIRTQQQWITSLEQNLRTIESELTNIQPEIERITEKINTPNTKKNINFAMKDALKANNACRSKVYELCDEVEQKRLLLRQAVFERNFEVAIKQIYAADTVYNALKNRQKVIDSEGRRVDKMLQQTKKKVISYNRALEIAENIFVKGEWKKWREDYRKFRKTFADLDLPNKKEDFAPKIEKLHSLLAKEPEKATYLFAALKGLEKFNAEKKQLEEICSHPENRTKIVEIAYGIVRKNSGVLKRYNELKAARDNLLKQYREISEKRSIVKTRMAFDEKISRKNKNLLIGYSVKKPNIARNSDSYPSEFSVANLMAQAFGQSAKRNDADGIVQLRANLDGTEIPMSWATMSEFAKDEQKLKELSREI